MRGDWLASGLQFTDTIGRVIPPVPQATNSTTGCPNLGQAFQPVTGSTTWQVPGPNNGNLNLLICYTSVSVRTTFFGSQRSWYVDYWDSDDNPHDDTYSEIYAGFGAIQSIVLSDGSYWGFIYDGGDPNNENDIGHYGTLSRLIMPQGGTIDYDYAPPAIADGSPFLVTGRRVSDGLHAPYQWNYSIADDWNGTGNTAINYSRAPNGNDTIYDYSTRSPSQQPQTVIKHYQGNYTSGQLLKTDTTAYSLAYAPVLPGGAEGGWGNRLAQQTITTPDTGLSSTAATSYTGTFASTMRAYGTYWDFGTSSWQYYPVQVYPVTLSLSIPQSTAITDYSGIPLRTTTTNYKWESDSRYLAANLLDTPEFVTALDDQSNQVAQTTTEYDEAPYVCNSGVLAGHATTATAWNNAGNSLSTHTAWTCKGMVDHTVDIRGITSAQFTYGSSYLGLFPTGVANALGQPSTYAWDLNTGNPVSVQDANQVVTTYDYDSLGRRVTVKAAVGTPQESWTRYAYPDAKTVNVAQDQSSKGDGVLTSSTVSDALGRVIDQFGPNHADVDTEYDGVDQITSISNPYFSTRDPTYGVTSFAYDALGRKTMQCQQDNGSWPNPCVAGNSYLQWSYSGNTVTSTDEAGNSKTQAADALGRLSGVTEAGGQYTAYSYDALDNLTHVYQYGLSGETARLRTFNYDSLSRLLSATNPETATVSFSYLDFYSGGLCSGDSSLPCNKTDARGSRVNYFYDNLNRMKDKSGAGLWYHYGYDSQPDSSLPNNYTVGRLVWATNNTSADEVYSYDPLGRVNWQSSWTPSSPNHTSIVLRAAYDLAGEMTDLTYPDGYHIQQAWDSGGQLCNIMNAMAGQATCGSVSRYNYFYSTAYYPNGALRQAVLGNGLIQSVGMNYRGQKNEIALRTAAGSYYVDRLLQYGNSGATCPVQQPTANNGNVTAVLNVNGTDQSRDQWYCYDNLNRLVSFYNRNNTMSQTYTLDSFGNAAVSGGTLLSNAVFDPNDGSNRLSSASGYLYDGAGNVTNAPNPSGGSYQFNYDTEGKLATTGNPASPSALYTYDANGMRVRKESGGAWTEYISFGGVPIAEKNNTGSWSDYIFANGQRIARFDPPTNLVPYSQQFGSGSWIGYCGPTSNMTVNTTDVAAPDGTSTATKFVAPATISCGSSTSWGVLTDIPSGLQTGQTYTVSIWLRGATGGEYVSIGLNDCAETSVTLTTSWQRYTVTYPNISSGTATCEGGRGFQVLDWTPSATYYAWGAQTELAATAGPYVATGSSTHYYTADHLGTTTVVTDAVGNLQNDSDYYPFGAENAITTADPNHYKFTGKERDAESATDYFGARYYSFGIGRFMVSDPGWIFASDASDPQSWNSYVYARNNPLSNVDFDGYDCVYLNSAGTDVDRDANGNITGVDTNSDRDECSKNHGYWVDGTVDLRHSYVFGNSDAVSLTGHNADGSATDSYYVKVKDPSTSWIIDGLGYHGMLKGTVDVSKLRVLPTVDPTAWWNRGCLAEAGADLVKDVSGYALANDAIEALQQGSIAPLFKGTNGFEIAEKSLESLSENKAAQAIVRTTVRAAGGAMSMRRAGKLMGLSGKVAGKFGTGIAIGSAVASGVQCAVR